MSNIFDRNRNPTRISRERQTSKELCIPCFIESYWWCTNRMDLCQAWLIWQKNCFQKGIIEEIEKWWFQIFCRITRFFSLFMDLINAEFVYYVLIFLELNYILRRILLVSLAGLRLLFLIKKYWFAKNFLTSLAFSLKLVMNSSTSEIGRFKGNFLFELLPLKFTNVSCNLWVDYIFLNLIC